MKILVTGSKGFVGKNLITELKNRGYTDIFEYDMDTNKALLEHYAKECNFVFHLAGVNRPENETEYMKGNFGFTTELLNLLTKNNNSAPILVTSSIQAQLDNAYGRSKKAGEDCIFSYSKETKSKVYVYRLPNVFGKWCRPNYNSAIATFCNNVANGLPITVNDPNVIMNLVYIDDVVAEFISAMEGHANLLDQFCAVPVTYKAKLGYIADTIRSFSEYKTNLYIPNVGNELEKKLYSTYLSYLPTDQFSYPLKMNVDERGSFTEIIRTPDRGQFSVNISKPGITKGNHWHHTKNEKFVVVKGKGLIQFRKIGTDEVLDYHVTGEKIEVIDIPTGYTHNIINEGETDMVTFMWANEAFNPDKPDTYFEKV
ncbi:NAD-dependent epimerase/dehydratase family protein [Paludicola sp. MB14-C6]|uniref:polysaccharide biosynthesis C-terminal domain-containing protein n=1 Tax=Paludihabitans sp. MB14-C6 TaxID=3070656 RepID=UPI0027DD42A7|nr:NAD-dependent epimerase/dehydratase family protein [Paludicola sp. MB14-C6]WMJ22935.1 NAD-dependent epimerase/dehydratase family protein [Paludicola sp. MB14-C6]